MPYVKNNAHRDMPFSSQTPIGEFYTYSSVAELAEQSEVFKEVLFRCRTVGILHSVHGRFFVTDLNSPTLKDDQPKIRISMMFLRSPPKSTIIPYPVQVFGTLQWKNRPVVFASILQEICPPMAIMIRDALTAVARAHLARQINNNVIQDLDDEKIDNPSTR